MEENRNIPNHVAIIMDGNGRWATNRTLGRIRGHIAGIKSVRRVVNSALDAGVKYLTLFTFSSENWGRPEDEVRGLMSLLSHQLKREVPDLIKAGVRVNVIGQLDKLPPQARKTLDMAMEMTASCQKLDLVLALSYGGRAEIIDAVKSMMREGLSPDQVDEEAFRKHLYAPGIPDPDLVIRTSGEMRISNFLLWQMAYSEIYFTDVLWPDFGEADFVRAISSYKGRTRRFGLTDRQVSSA